MRALRTTAVPGSKSQKPAHRSRAAWCAATPDRHMAQQVLAAAPISRCCSWIAAPRNGVTVRLSRSHFQVPDPATPFPGSGGSDLRPSGIHARCHPGAGRRASPDSRRRRHRVRLTRSSRPPRALKNSTGALEHRQLTESIHRQGPSSRFGTHAIDRRAPRRCSSSASAKPRRPPGDAVDGHAGRPSARPRYRRCSSTSSSINRMFGDVMSRHRSGLQRDTLPRHYRPCRRFPPGESCAMLLLRIAARLPHCSRG